MEASTPTDTHVRIPSRIDKVDSHHTKKNLVFKSQRKSVKSVTKTSVFADAKHSREMK